MRNLLPQSAFLKICQLFNVQLEIVFRQAGFRVLKKLFDGVLTNCDYLTFRISSKSSSSGYCNRGSEFVSIMTLF